jgi:preprotein translocase subunit SecA
MIHIDRMSHLKEEVAFEGFAQKQPLVVYKERAYDRFIGLMQAVSLQVSHGIFSFIPGSVVPEFTSSIDE